MKTGILPILYLFFQIFITPLQAQHSTPVAAVPSLSEPVPYGLSNKEWNYVERVWKRNRYPVSLQLKDSSLINGQILHRNDTLLILWAHNKSFFNPCLADSLIRVYNMNCINGILAYRYFTFKYIESGLLWGPLAGVIQGIIMEQVIKDWNGVFLLVAGIAVGVGATAEAIRIFAQSHVVRKNPINLEALPEKKQKKYCLLPDKLPDPMLVSANNATVDTHCLRHMTFNELAEISPRVNRIFSIPRWYFSPLYGSSFPKYNSSYKSGTFGGLAGYQLSSHMLIDYRYLYSEGSLNDDIVVYNHPYCWVSKQSHTLTLQFVPRVVDRFLSKRFEWNFGINGSLNRIRYSEGDYTEKKLPGGLGLMAGMDLYLTRGLSINVLIERSFIQDINIEKHSVYDIFTGQEIMVPSQTIDPSSFDIVIGLKFHL